MRQLFRVIYSTLLLLLIVSGPARAFQPFVIEDIQLEGLQRISAGTVFNYLPVRVGDVLDERASAKAIKALFKTGFFKDIRIEREGNVLILALDERAAIADISLSGNKQLETDKLLEALKGSGFSTGQVFDRSILDRVTQELRRLYFSQGKYGVKIETTVTPLDRNRVGISFDISEGRVAKIKQLNIIGNRAFSDKELKKNFRLGASGFFSFYSRNDQYSKTKLGGDLERLRSWYLDRGFINFNIDSTQISITPDKRHIYITVNISEGEVFTVADVSLSGDLKLPRDELMQLVGVKAGDVFSRKQITKTTSAITERLGDNGYAFANINAVPEIDKENRTVSLSFFIDPGKRVYVRRINFSGNEVTSDEVLRREMRQMEGGWISTSQVKRSQVRLRKTGFFDEVNVETPAVPGTTDQVDVNFSVDERPGGNLLAGVGFSQGQGFLFNGSLTQNNFLGTGKRVSAAFNTGDVNTVYSFAYDNPYYTIDGVSRGFTTFFRKTDAAEANVTNFTSDVFGGSVRFGVPINEFDTVRLELGYESTKITSLTNVSNEIISFLNENGVDYDAIKLTATYSHDSRNSAIFPDRGRFERAVFELAAPGAELNYYKVQYRVDWYRPLTEAFTLLLKGQISAGDAYGNTTQLPFFENFYAGGPRSVRGYDENSLGPRDSRGDPIGGNVRMVGNAELLIPPPFDDAKKRVRLSAFLDMGNVWGFNQTFDAAEIRFSTGLALKWLSPVGALTFSFAVPFNDLESDDQQQFQFTFGTAF